MMMMTMMMMMMYEQTLPGGLGSELGKKTVILVSQTWKFIQIL